MSLPHFYLREERVWVFENLRPAPGDRLSDIVISNSEIWKHFRSLRLKPNDGLILVDKPGHAWELRLNTLPNYRKSTLDATVVAELTSSPGHQITLVQGISVGERMEQTIRQCSELAVSRIIPLQSERSTVRLDEQAAVAKQKRWQRLALAASEQSGNLYCPQITVPLELGSALELVRPAQLKVLFWEDARENCQPFVSAFAQSLCAFTSAPEVAIFIGPEGGFSGKEAQEIKAAGAEFATLGSTVLRTETAAVVATALVGQCLDARFGRAGGKAYCGC
jgi:16S rRNA (uracil1498-N3)-methyltransferase